MKIRVRPTRRNATLRRIMPRRARPDNSLPEPPEPTQLPADDLGRLRAAIRLLADRIGPHIISADSRAQLDQLLEPADDD